MPLVCVLSFVLVLFGCLVWRADREGILMRANKIMNYESILQVLGETGCPFFMAEELPGYPAARS